MSKVKLLMVCLLINTVFFSCAPKRLTEFTEMCICEVTEHYTASTDELESRMKEFSFVNSPVFDLGVSEESFATSTAILFNQKWDLDSMSIININLVKESEGGNKIVTYEFGQRQLNKMSQDYSKTLVLVNSFVDNIYQGNYEQCKSVVDAEMDSTGFNAIMDKVRSGLEEDYIDTRIVGYNRKKNICNIYGGVWTKNETLDLFRMQLKETENGLRILSFEF